MKDMTYKFLCSGGNYIYTEKRKLKMFQYGGTIGPSQFPTYLRHSDQSVHMLPRPVVKSRPHRLGHRIMTMCVWLCKLVQDIESLTLKHLELDKSPTSVIIQKTFGG